MEKLNLNAAFEQLEQDIESDIEVLKLIDGDPCFVIAQLKSGRTLSAHYHNEGSEIYQILSGEGKMETGKLSGTHVLWNQCFQISQGDVFEIKANRVHRLSNVGQDPLKLVFITPPSHLGEDRFFL